MENNTNDVDMPSVTPYSNWEFLSPNDNPEDRCNCFIATAAGLMGLNSVHLEAFERNTTITPYVRGIYNI
jgi:hypothetical protein